MEGDIDIDPGDIGAGAAGAIWVGAGAEAGGRLAERQAHGDDLLLLFDDDFLRDAPQLLVLAVAQFRHRHVDRALVVRDHHGGEVGVDVAGWLRRHPGHHPVHRGAVLRQERRFVRVERSRPRFLSANADRACEAEGESERSRSRNAALIHEAIPRGWRRCVHMRVDAVACGLFRPWRKLFQGRAAVEFAACRLRLIRGKDNPRAATQRPDRFPFATHGQTVANMANGGA